ncbi:MAG: MBL fold metallo-hydrolase [Luteolibacter sp.]|jgi:N-acyl-phosphatidylethanolamine-hydrolysing phospholipase D|nr:MBL fold metallo-hydrolase [Luteolibacter sp.]
MNPRFTNPWPHPQHRVLDILRWKLGLGPGERSHLPDAPDLPASWIALAPERIALPPPAGWRAVWLGHASFLLQGCGVSLLIDPVFSDFCAPLPFPSLRRKVPPPCDLTDLPPIDAVLLTHSHYDHLDLPTLRILGPSTRLWVPEGHAAWLRKKGFTAVEEVRWNESFTLHPHLRITATPAQHFTARSLHDRDRAHWCGWRIDSPQGSLWHAGDSGYCPAFREIGERHGPVDLGMIPIGAYQPRHIMQAMHLNPEEAVRVFLETRCRHAIAIHWGTFRLTDEALGEPPLWLEMALREKNLPAGIFTAGSVGAVHEFVGASTT